MDARELRLRILKALSDWDRSGNSELPEAQQLAKDFGVSLHDVLDQFDILESDAAVEVYRVAGGGSNATALITGTGKKMIEEEQQSHQSQSAPEPLLLDSTGRATELLESLASDLCAVTFSISDLVSYLRTYLMAIRLLGWNEEWIIKELNGYSYDDGIPPWRLVEKDNVWYLSQPVVDLVSSMRHESTLPAWETINRNEGYAIHNVSRPSVIKVLDQISEKLFDDVSKALVAVKFGQVTANVFRKYQDSVSAALVRLGIEDHLKAAYQNLLQDNEAGWQAAVEACRNIMYKLSETLWQLQDKTYPYLKSKGESDMRVTRNEPRNRIRAYLNEKGITSDDMPRRMIDPLFSMASAGKRTVSYAHAQSVLLLTYIFVAEMIRLTDMIPVAKVRKL